MTAPTELVLFGGQTMSQHELKNPHCPKCGRGHAEKFTKPKHQHLSYRCSCGHVWDAKS